MKQRLLACWLVCACLMAAPALSQEQRGAIEGTIKDTSGAVLPGVTVEATGTALVGIASTITDARGMYSFPALPPGVYDVTASLAGFATTKMPGIELTLGKTLRADMTLAVAAMAEVVNVTGESPLIDTTRSAVTTNLGRKEFDLVPKGRDFTSVATLAPGANDESKLGGLSIDGASGAENVFYVDGMDVTNLSTGTSAKSVIMDLIDEVQVKSSGYDAEYGGALGGVVNVVTRSGSNTFKGEVNYYFTGSALTASPNPELRLGLTNSNIAEQVTYAEDRRTSSEPGFMLGGYLLKDRLWFYGAYFPQIQRTKRTVQFATDRSTKSVTEKRRSDFVLAKVTAQISKDVRANFSANVNPSSVDGRLPKADGTDNPAFPFDTLSEKFPNATYSANVDWVANSKLYVNARGGYFKYDDQASGIPAELRYSFNDSNMQIADIPTDLRRPTGWSNIPTNTATQRDEQTRLSFAADATYVANMAGRHTLKAGLQFTRLGTDMLTGDQADNVVFYWGRAYTARSTGLRYRGPYGYYSHVQFYYEGKVHSNNLGIFLQDSWRIKDRLTLNLGVRTEREEIPSFDVNRTEPVLTFGFKDKIAPRLGATYDVRGDGKFRVYGGYGKFYDVMKLSLPRNAFGGAHRLTYFYTLDSYDWPSYGPDNYPGSFIEVVNGRPNRSDAIDPDIRPVQSEELSLGADHEIGARMSLGVRYIHKKLLRTTEDVGYVGASGSTEYFIGNPGFGVTEDILKYSRNQGGFPPGVAYPKLPKARRDYDAVEVRFTRRFSNSWSANLSYTLSRLFGNYTGLVASDELSGTNGTGRLSPNASASYDQAYNVFGPDANGNCCSTPLYRHLPTDKPHQFKAQAIYDFGKGLTAGANFYLSSGMPKTRSFWKTNDIFFLGDLSDGRTPTYSQADINVRYDLPLTGRTRLQLALNILNLLDQRTETAYYMTVNKTSTGVSFTDVEFFAGQLDVMKRIADQKLSLDPRFSQARYWQNPRTAFVSARLLF